MNAIVAVDFRRCASWTTTRSGPSRPLRVRAAYGVAYALPLEVCSNGRHPRKGLIPRRRPAAPLSQRHCAWPALRVCHRPTRFGSYPLRRSSRSHASHACRRHPRACASVRRRPPPSDRLRAPRPHQLLGETGGGPRRACRRADGVTHRVGRSAAAGQGQRDQRGGPWATAGARRVDGSAGRDMASSSSVDAEEVFEALSPGRCRSGWRVRCCAVAHLLGEGAAAGGW